MKRAVVLPGILSVNLALYLFNFPVIAQDLVITGVLDGPLKGGTPKCVEIYVINDIADLSLYSLGSANNGGGTDGPEFNFPADPVSSGDFIYIASETSYFNSFFGFVPAYTTKTVSINGDDAIELFHQSVVIDVFGDINTDGTGQSWEYTDGWVYRKKFTRPDSSEFNLDHWYFSGVNALDGESSNSNASVPFPVGNYSYSPDPEPAEHVTNFNAVSPIFSRIRLSWTDTAIINQPSGYLIKGSANGFADITVPQDGFVEENGSLVKNLPAGTNTCIFYGLSASQIYYFKIFPYSNLGEHINYKTGGSVPEINCTTASIDTIILFEDFETCLNWTVINDTGDLGWIWTSGGADQTLKAAYITGYSDGTKYNTDWLVSPAIRWDLWSDKMLNFYTLWENGNNDSADYLKLFYSGNYSGDPSGINEAHWYEIPFSFNSEQVWNKTNDIDLSWIDFQTIHLAFKYRSQNNARTWFVDEILLKGKYAGDQNPPVFQNGSPRIENVRDQQIDLIVNMNETGQVFFILENDGDPAPSRDEVKLGYTLNFSNPDIDYRITLDSLKMATSYDLYFLAQDTSGNIQDTTTLVKVKTLDPREISLLSPEEEETYYLNDTLWIIWSSRQIDSMQLIIYSNEQNTWKKAFEKSIIVLSSQDSLWIHLTPELGVDSLSIRLADAGDPDINDTCGTIYLLDTLTPVISSVKPGNNTTGVLVNDTFTITFNEKIFPGTGFVVIWKNDRSEWDSIEVKSDQLNYAFNQVEIIPGNPFRYGTEYFVLIDSGAFRDYQGNVFSGIKKETTWSFRTESAVEVHTVENLRECLQEVGTVYKLTSEVILTAQTNYRNKKYIQDATAGIEIDDSDIIITASYSIGDGIKGITGSLNEYNGMLQLIPVENPGSASSTGNIIPPAQLSVAEYKANYEIYESQLIRFNNVIFEDAGETFTEGTNYSIIQETDTLNLRTHFYPTDLTGSTIPEYASVTGIAINFKDIPEIAPRFLADVEEIIEQHNENHFISHTLIYPNPNNGCFNLKWKGTKKCDMILEIFNLSGKIVNRYIYKDVMDLSDQIDLTHLPSGLYILKSYVGKELFMEKIIVKPSLMK